MSAVRTHTYLTRIFLGNTTSKHETHLDNIWFSRFKMYVLVYNCLNTHMICSTTGFFCSPNYKPHQQERQPHLFCLIIQSQFKVTLGCYPDNEYIISKIFHNTFILSSICKKNINSWLIYDMYVILTFSYWIGLYLESVLLNLDIWNKQIEFEFE
jgi:hypothetical protein